MRIIYEWTVIASLGRALAVGLFFGVYPATIASRLDPIDAPCLSREEKNDAETRRRGDAEKEEEVVKG